jgi:hypothetical protein
MRPESKDRESDLVVAIRKAVSSMPDVRLMRNSQYHARLADGSFARVGLGEGSPDLVGSLTLNVYRQDWNYGDDGYGIIARSVGIEVKTPGGLGKHAAREARQLEWLEYHRRAGWLVGVVTSVQDALDLLEKGRRWEL